MKTKYRSMLQGPLWSGVILYTIPIILTSVLQLLFNAADLVVVGRFCGSVSVAAIGATGSVTNLIVTLFMGLSVGAGVAVAHGIGSRNDEDIHCTVHTSLPTSLLGGAFLTVVGILCTKPLLRLMGTPENVLPLSAIYMQIIFGGMIFSLVYNFCAAILRAAGDTKGPLIYLTAAGILNVVLNLFFVTVLHMNVAGVALATIISQALSAVLVVIALMRRKDACRLELKKMRIYKPQLMKIIRIGLPAGIQGSLFGISNTMIQSSINSFGDIVMSGNAAAANIEGFVYVSFNSFQQTVTNYVGQNAGAGQYKRVYKSFWVCLISASVVGLITGLSAYIFAEPLLSIYITDSPEAIAYGLVRISMVSAPYFLCALMEVTTGALRGMGSSTEPMLISILGICGVRILWIYTVFAAFPTPRVLYLSYMVTWIITFAFQLLAFLRVYRKQLQAMQMPPLDCGQKL